MPESFGITKIEYLDRELQQALAAEALVGVLRRQMSTSSRREFHTCTLALRRVLVLTNKRSTTARTRFVFHSYLSILFTSIFEGNNRFSVAKVVLFVDICKF